MGHPWDNLYYKNEGKGDAVSCLIAKYPDCLSYCVINDRNPTVGADTPDSALPEAYREKIDKKWYVYKCRPLIGTQTVLRNNTVYCGESTKLNLVPDEDFCNNNISRAKLLVSKNFFLDRVEEQGTRYWQGDIVYKGAKISDDIDYDWQWIGEVAIEVRPVIDGYRITTIANLQASPYYGLLLEGKTIQQSRFNGVGTLIYDVYRSYQKGKALRVPYSYPSHPYTFEFEEVTSKPYLLVVEGDRNNHCQLYLEDYIQLGMKDYSSVYAVEADSVVNACYAPYVNQPFYRNSRLDWCSCNYHILPYLRNHIDGTQESLLRQVQYANCYNNRPCGYSVWGSQRIGVYENAILLKTNATNIMYCSDYIQGNIIASGRLRYLDTTIDSNISFNCSCYNCGNCYNCGTCYNCYCGCYSCSCACTECFRKGRINEVNPVLGYLAPSYWKDVPTERAYAVVTVKDYGGYNSRLELYLNRFWMGLRASVLKYHLSGKKLFEWDEATETERIEQILAGGYSAGSQNHIDIVLWNVSTIIPNDAFWYTNKSSTPMQATIDNGRISISIYDMLVSMGKENATSEEMAEALESVDIFIVVGCKTADAIILNYDESKIWEGMYPIGNLIENWMPCS